MLKKSKQVKAFLLYSQRLQSRSNKFSFIQLMASDGWQCGARSVGIWISTTTKKRCESSLFHSDNQYQIGRGCLNSENYSIITFHIRKRQSYSSKSVVVCSHYTKSFSFFSPNKTASHTSNDRCWSQKIAALPVFYRFIFHSSQTMVHLSFMKIVSPIANGTKYERASHGSDVPQFTFNASTPKRIHCFASPAFPIIFK